MKIAVPGGHVEATISGRGPAVLFLHAFPLSSAMWDAEAQALQASYTVVRFDARGFGASPPGDGLLTMERIADDAAAVLDHAGVGQAVVCGLSMGGYAAFAFARRHADRLRGLVLADTKASPDTPDARRNRSLQADKARRDGAAAIADAMLPRLLGRTSHASRPELVERVRATILATPVQGIVNGLAGLGARADSMPTLRLVNVPTLVVCGEEDELTPVADAEVMAKGIAGATLAVIPAAGHLANMENPAAFGEVLGSFLAERV